MRRNEVGRVSQRAYMILLSNRHFCVAKIAQIFDAREGTVRRWIERFEKEGINCLFDRPRSGRPPKVRAAALPLIERDVISSPASHGYPFTIWTTISISVHLLPPIRAMWMKRARQVRIPTPGTNRKKSIFGALDIRTGQWLYGIFDRKRTGQFIEFLNYIVSLYPTGKIHIILDNYSIHKAKLVEEWLTSHPRVKLYYLPCYMPQLNPVEKMWWRLKAVVAANRLYGTIGALVDSVETFFKELTASQALTLAA